MPRLSVRLVSDGVGDGEFPRLQLPVRLTNPFTGKKLTVNALVDTGAQVCVVDWHIAAALGHLHAHPDVKEAPVHAVGATTQAKIHTFDIELRDPKQPDRILFRAPNLKVQCLKSPFPCILGVRGFLEHFDIRIRYPQRTATLKW